MSSHSALRLIARLMTIMAAIMLGGILIAGSYLWVINSALPDYEKLANYEPPVMTRIHAGDGTLIAEYGYERRIYIPFQAIPKHVSYAFLAAEDKNFFQHTGVDLVGISRAMVSNILNIVRGQRLEGASTITQQVAKNFLLNNDVTLQRKVREALLAFRIDRAYSKERILELYLNEIYLGQRSYGVAAAALNYYGKALSELSVAEAAYLAALPKGPNNYHPFRYPQRAVERRNWVIGRMEEVGYISSEDADAARAEPLKVVERPMGAQIAGTEFFVEEVRRDLARMYGEDTLYKQGLSVRTTLDPKLQRVARRALRDGLVEYDRRHGWRGAMSRLPLGGDVASRLYALAEPNDLTPWRMGVVLNTSSTGATVGLRPLQKPNLEAPQPLKKVFVPFDAMAWTRRASVSQVVDRGDVIFVSPQFGADRKVKTGADGLALYQLEQKPKVEGALISLDPHTGRVLALVGGFSHFGNDFNRATQAQRQPGSSFKPFVYAAALDNGYTPSTLVLDAPIALSQGAGRGLWKPENYGGDFYGPSTLRFGIEKSRNVMTVRLAQQVGMAHIVDYARRFGISDNMEPVLAMALGAGETTLLKMTTAYGMLVNGGKRVTPTLIDRVQDRYGKSIYRHDKRECRGCNMPEWKGGLRPPVVTDPREQVIEPSTAYQVVSMLEGVVQRGTAWRLRELGLPLGGKTGTTNDERDAWFVGFSPDLVTGVFVGFDAPKPMGRGETGGRVAVPIFQAFMEAALKGHAPVPFRIPPGVTLVRVDPKSGQRVGPEAPGAILEPFKMGTEPGFGAQNASIVGGEGITGGASDNSGAVNAGTGGLY